MWLSDKSRRDQHASHACLYMLGITRTVLVRAAKQLAADSFHSVLLHRHSAKENASWAKPSRTLFQSQWHLTGSLFPLTVPEL